MDLDTARRLRIRIVLPLVILALAALGVRLFYIQCATHERYVALSEGQHRLRIEIPARRGTLLSREGTKLAVSLQLNSLYAEPNRIEDPNFVSRALTKILDLNERKTRLALTQPKGFVWIKRDVTAAESDAVTKLHMPGVGLRRDVDEELSVYAEPNHLRNPMLAARTLAKVLDIDEKDVVDTLLQRRPFVWIKRKLTDEQCDAVASLRIKGLGFRHEFKRFYPKTELLCQCLGYCNIDNQGLEGLELSMNQTLAGKPGFMVVEKDVRGRPISPQPLKEQDAVDGSDVTLTIDSTIQTFAQEELDTACQKLRPVAGHAVVMNPYTGEILALANYPEFDPNHFEDYKPDDLKTRANNGAVVRIFEPGSTFKPLVAASLLDENLASEASTYVCGNGVASIAGRTLHCLHHHGTLSLVDVIAKSCNIGASKMGVQLGPKALYTHLLAFGLGKKTGLPFGQEPAGMLAAWRRWTNFTLTSVPIGQEVAVTPLQLLNAFCTFANGGVLMKPTIVSSITAPDGRVSSTRPVEISRPISSSSAERMKPILAKVVSDGTGTMAKSSKYILGGKTGTAQKALVGRRGYSEKAVICTFAAFAPVEVPKIAVIVVIDEPRAPGRHFGGTASAPVVKNIVERTLAYMHVPPQQFVTARQNSEVPAAD